jgi:hypothetical protein
MFDPNNQNTLHTPSDPASQSNPNNPSHSNPQFDARNPYPRPSRKPPERGLWGWLAYLTLVLFLMVVMVGSISLGNNPSPSYFPPIFVQQLPVQLLLAIGIGSIAVLWLLIGISLRTPLSHLMGEVGALSLLAFVALAYFWAGFINPYVSMTRTSFPRSSVSISSGTTLHVQNPADGVTQILCIGINQKCQPEHGAPDVLNQGIRVQPGQIVTIPFAIIGEYHITSETMPGMNLFVDVGDGSD